MVGVYVAVNYVVLPIDRFFIPFEGGLVLIAGSLFPTIYFRNFRGRQCIYYILKILIFVFSFVSLFILHVWMSCEFFGDCM